MEWLYPLILGILQDTEVDGLVVRQEKENQMKLIISVYTH